MKCRRLLDGILARQEVLPYWLGSSQPQDVEAVQGRVATNVAGSASRSSPTTPATDRKANAGRTPNQQSDGTLRDSDQEEHRRRLLLAHPSDHGRQRFRTFHLDGNWG